MDLKTDLIITGFLGGSEEIYRCNASGKATAVYEYAVVGEGEYLAEASLLQRGQNDIKSLDETLYNVYEAKKHAESVGSVGKLTSIYVFSSDGTHKLIGANAEHQLLEMYRQYGPKDLPSELKLEGVKYHREETSAAIHAPAPRDSGASG